MNREQALLVADRQRSQARVLTRRGDLERAGQILVQLIETLRPSLAGDETEGSAPATSRAALAGALADAYGMLGGVEWRQGDLTKALRAYEEGRALEETDDLAITDSYNLVNSIVVSLLLRPSEVNGLQHDLQVAISEMRAQLEGERRDQWWAWADYAVLLLLTGDTDQAFDAYARFESCGPTLTDYQAVLRVLRDLADALGTVDADMEASVWEAADYLSRGLARA